MSDDRVTGAPSRRVWIIAALELVVALAITRLVLASGEEPSNPHHQHMPGMSHEVAPSSHWGATDYGLLVVIALSLGIWFRWRNVIPAFVAATAIACLVASRPVRVLAAGSHLVAMVSLELTLVVAPILVCSALTQLRGRSEGPRRGATVTTVALAVGYAALVIVIHLPPVHGSLAELGMVPSWVVGVAAVIGTGYWLMVFGPLSAAPINVRRRALLGAQEVSAFIGLLSIFGAWGGMAHANSLGLSAAWDQRLGGLFMLATCAAVAIPLERRLSARAPALTSTTGA